jgi:hypothetical protein
MPKPKGALSWPVWSLAEARRQQQLELFAGFRSVDPHKAELKREKRRAKQPGVYVP